ncbi:hypothetical protein [Tuwongella immobilis]|uniref:Lipoprotein n=1 Tax=Tuwongella immobilis TaxID=692036 RepID=A0A6C2YNE2_9BACT|nr:hypothetical protein [Tuwongella immobilis]VIP02643.1 unnamed protein product [Tuwongella immobilis]VTS02018.1 unnamed protein product [Tuwongella immobilis]
MRFPKAFWCLGLCLLGGVVGCGGGVQEEMIEVKGVDPYAQVRSTLTNYIKGQPMSSEVTSFDYMVNEIKKVDPAKADILKAGLDDMVKSKGGLAGKAKALLTKLGLKEAGK